MPDVIALPRDDSGLRRLSGALASALAALDVPQRLAYRAQLVAEEILTNLVKYGQVPGHPDTAGAPDLVRLSLHSDLDGQALTLVIEDATVPFSPVWAAQPAPQTDISSALPGGLGLSLVRKSCDRLDYESFEGGNRLVARFRL